MRREGVGALPGLIPTVIVLHVELFTEYDTTPGSSELSVFSKTATDIAA